MKKIILIILSAISATGAFAMPITGNLNICPGSVSALTDTSFGGIWVSGATSIATIDSFSGNIMGVAPGTALITYYYPGGGSSSVTVTVNPLPAVITGTTSVCVDQAITLADVTAGGLWSSNNSFVAMVSDSTGMVTGISADTVGITYTGPNGCSRTAIVTVNPVPVAIATSGTYCQGIADSLFEAGTGIWGTDAPLVISLGTSGNITGLSVGTANITFTNSFGCAISTSVTVNPAPHAGTVTANDFVCIAASITCTSDSCCGNWSSSDATVATIVSGSGTVTGVAAGLAIMTYSVTNSCGTATATKGIQVLSDTDCNKLSVKSLTARPEELVISPNPATDGNFSVTINTDKEEPAAVVISNMTGEKVYELTTTTNKKNEIKLDTPAGIYLISATIEHGKYVGKIVVE